MKTHLRLCSHCSLGSDPSCSPCVVPKPLGTLPPAPWQSSPSPAACRLPPRGCSAAQNTSYRPEALMARVAAEWPSSREWMKTSVIFSPPMKVSCQGEKRDERDVVVRRPHKDMELGGAACPSCSFLQKMGKSFGLSKYAFQPLLWVALTFSYTSGCFNRPPASGPPKPPLQKWCK